MVNKDVYIISR